MLLIQKLNILTGNLSTGKKLSTDNGNILNLNLKKKKEKQRNLFEIVHFDCESVFFFFFF